jgi:hypothetical protein
MITGSDKQVAHGQSKDGHLPGGVIPAKAGIHENAGFRIKLVL